MVDSAVRAIAPAGGPTPLPPLDVELGVSHNMPFSTAYGVDGAVLNNQDVTIQQLVNMRRNDGQARSLMRIITLPIRAGVGMCKVIPEEGGEKEAEFIDQMLKLPPAAGGMTVTLQRFISQALIALFDGFAVFEPVFTYAETGPLAGNYVLHKMARRPPETITFLADKNGGYAGVRQVTSWMGRTVDVILPPSKSWYFAANEEENPFYGVSWFLPAFYHYDKKVKLYYIAHLAAQHRATPGRLGKLPPNPNAPELQSFKKALTDYGVAGAMMVPSGYEVDELGKTLSQFNFVELIDHHNNQMSKSVCAQFIDDQQRKVLADFTTDKDEMFILALQSVMDDLQGNINNYLIPQFIDWNFGTGKYPQFKFAPLSDEAKQAIRETFDKIMTSASVHVTEDFMFELEAQVAEQMGLEIDYEALRAKFEADKALKARVEKAQAEQIINPPASAPVSAPAKPKAVAASAEVTPVLEVPQPVVSLAAAARQLLEDADAELAAT